MGKGKLWIATNFVRFEGTRDYGLSTLSNFNKQEFIFYLDLEAESHFIDPATRKTKRNLQNVEYVALIKT